MSLGLSIPEISQSRSRHPRNFLVSRSLGLDIQYISQSRWVSVSTSTNYESILESFSQKKQPNKRNLTKLKKSKSNSIHLLDQVCFLQHQIPSWDVWVSPVGEKNSMPTNLAIVRGPVSYRIHFMACRSFSSPPMGGAEISGSLGIGIDIFCPVSL